MSGDAPGVRKATGRESAEFGFYQKRLGFWFGNHVSARALRGPAGAPGKASLPHTLRPLVIADQQERSFSLLSALVSRTFFRCLEWHGSPVAMRPLPVQAVTPFARVP
jgi:hypothetical protein